MIEATHYRRLVKTSAWYDLFATVGFATPWTFAVVHTWLSLAAQDLPGSFPAFDASHVLMANLLGSIVTVWAVLRIRNPQPQFGRYDAAARFLFAAWQIYAVANGANVIILGFTVVELFFGIAQSLPTSQTDSEVGVTSTRASTTAVDPAPLTHLRFASENTTN